MRQVKTGLLLAGVLLLSGCSNINPRPKGTADVGRRWDSRQPNSATLVAYLNDNTRQVQAIQSVDVTLDCRQGSQKGAIPYARIDCQKPRNFRLTGKAGGQPLVDLGSNESEFWYWIKPAQPYVFHCSHEGLARGGVRMPFPFQPDMILQALGMSE